MRNYRVFCVVAIVGAAAAMLACVAPAWAKKTSAQAQTSQQIQSRQQTPAPNNCPGGVSKGCGPGSCRCP